MQYNFDENKIKHFLAHTPNEARNILNELLGDTNSLIINHDFELYELGFHNFLAETDLCIMFTDPFLQQAYETTNSISLRKKLQNSLQENARSSLPEFNKRIKEFSSTAEIGISSADIIAADRGSLFIISPSMAESLTCTTPKKHIVIVGIEKILNSFFAASELAITYAKMLDQRSNVNIHIISNPSRTGDIEKIVVYGAHGPRELDVILLDNHRSKLLKEEPFSGIFTHFITRGLEIFRPDLKMLSDCLDLPTIDPLKLFILAENASDEFLLKISVLSDIIITTITQENLPFSEDIIRAYKRVIDYAISRGKNEEEIKQTSKQLYETFIGERHV